MYSGYQRAIDKSIQSGRNHRFKTGQVNRQCKRSFVEKTGKYIISKILNITGCYEPFYHLNILFNGDVILYYHDWHRATVIGNVRKSSLKEIWNSQKLNDIRRLILRKKYAQIVSCRNCSLAT